MTLEDWLKQDRSLADQLKVIEGLCSTLNEAHERREVHRGIDPAHIDVASDGRCDLSGAVSSSPGPRYRAPEVTEGGPPSPESDIYSAGVIFYEMLGGRSPSGERPTPLADLRPEVSRDLTDAIMGCLERGPDWRPKDLSYLLQVVGSMRGAGVKPAGRAASRAPETPRFGAARSTSRKTAGGSGSKSNVPLLGLAVLLAIGAGAGGWWYFTQGSETSGTRVAPPPTAAPTTLAAVAPSATPPPPVVATPKPGAPSPKPTPGPTPTPVTVATPGPTPPPVTRPVATPEPVRSATPPPATPPPVSVAPAPTPTPPPPMPAEPAVLTAVSPLTVKRGITTMLDVRGTGLRPEHLARVVKIKEAVTGVSVVRQKWVDPTLIKVLVNIEAGAAPGAYAVALVDGQGTQTNGLSFSVSK
jgi:hypothetical protein